jgi:hypothetical protein
MFKWSTEICGALADAADMAGECTWSSSIVFGCGRPRALRALEADECGMVRECSDAIDVAMAEGAAAVVALRGLGEGRVCVGAGGEGTMVEGYMLVGLLVFDRRWVRCAWVGRRFRGEAVG